MKEYRKLTDIQHDLKAGTITCSALVSAYLDRIDQNRGLNAIIEVFAEEAQHKAVEIDQKIQAGTAGKLAGLVITLKDNIAYEGHEFTASSNMLSGFKSLFSATITKKLLEEDAIIIGRTNCDEFAMGSSNETSVYGPVKNPIDLTRVPGGSSGGSAAAVAANLCHASLGTDTGGSIRQPAAYCGIYGFKPTYGRVSRHGLIAFASSFDQAGPFTRSLEDLALITEIISGSDDFDATASDRPVPSMMIPEKVSPKKFAIIKEVRHSTGLHPEVKAAFEKIISELEQAGNVVEEVSFPYIDYCIPTYYVLTTAEASSNLSRFNGVTYGQRFSDAKDLEEMYKKTRSAGFGTEVKRRIMLGTFVLSEGYYDAYYSKAQKVRRVLKDSMDEILNNYDVIIMPSTPSFPFVFGEKSTDPIEMYLEDIFTAAANLTGHPAISIPAGNGSQGLPIGIQLMGKSFDEAGLFAAASLIKN
jgi:aspartyl-tRNA(Asn)/glutamyl-tRNA(Gln) amidotransferase subunit A